MSGITQAVLAFTSSSTGWAFQSVGSAVLGASPTVTLPGTHGAGSLLVIAMNGGNTNVTTPAGWTASVNTTTSPRLCLFYKIDGGSETSVAISGGGSNSQAIMLSYSGINATPLDINGTATSATTTTPTTTSLTTTAVNDLVISIFIGNNNASTWSGLPVTGCTTRYDGGGLASTLALLVVDELKVAAGATTARTATHSTSVVCATMACSFKL